MDDVAVPVFLDDHDGGDDGVDPDVQDDCHDVGVVVPDEGHLHVADGVDEDDALRMSSLGGVEKNYCFGYY